MIVTYQDTFFQGEQEIQGKSKTATLPFARLSARALILRKSDGHILGMRHHDGGNFALPGGAFEDGETPPQTLLRELAEENVTLIDSDPDWQTKLTVDYFPGYRELTLWYLILVEDAQFGDCEEIIETRWIPQEEDILHKGMHLKLLFFIQQYAPQHSRLIISCL
jgi:8-oxo-dGTP pyrophosphatase MutT (NUDIX family)